MLLDEWFGLSVTWCGTAKRRFARVRERHEIVSCETDLEQVSKIVRVSTAQRSSPVRGKSRKQNSPATPTISLNDHGHFDFASVATKRAHNSMTTIR